MAEVEVIWTEYMQYRVRIRGFERDKVERVLLQSAERYLATSSGRTSRCDRAPRPAVDSGPVRTGVRQDDARHSTCNYSTTSQFQGKVRKIHT